MKTTEIPRRKFTVSVWPNSRADAMPVNIVATVEEYFFRIVSGTNKLCYTAEYHKGKKFLVKSEIVTQKHQVETYNNPH